MAAICLLGQVEIVATSVDAYISVLELRDRLLPSQQQVLELEELRSKVPNQIDR